MVETFAERFNRLTARMTVTQISRVLDVTEGAVRKLKRGDTQTMELHRALRLCRVLGVSPWQLIGENEPEPRNSGRALRAARLADAAPGDDGDSGDLMQRLDDAIETEALGSTVRRILEAERQSIRADLDARELDVKERLRELTEQVAALAAQLSGQRVLAPTAGKRVRSS